MQLKKKVSGTNSRINYYILSTLKECKILMKINFSHHHGFIKSQNSTQNSNRFSYLVFNRIKKRFKKKDQLETA